MITNGFCPGYSDVVTLDQYFTYNDVAIGNAMYIYVSGGGGDIVWENSIGEAQWLPGVLAGSNYIMGARRILTTGTVNGTSRTTTATGLVWMA